MPEFWQSWNSIGNLDQARRLAAFKTRFLEKHSEIYRPDVLGTGDPNATPDSMAKDFVNTIGPDIPKMRALSATLANSLPLYVAEFQRTFPDFRCNFPIYVLPSLGAFDGATRQINGEMAFLIGVDVLAETYGTADLGTFFTHELFHQYHWRTNPPPTGLYGSLWEEGLATYVSHVLNPRASKSVVLGKPADLAERARPVLPQLAAELLRNFDSQSSTAYAAFFLGGAKRSAFPPRSGYYVGHLIANDLARRYSLPQLAHLSGRQLRKEVRLELTKMSGGA
jgi:hypothetical protein